MVPFLILCSRMMMGRGPGRVGAFSLEARERVGVGGAGAFSLEAGERAGVLSLGARRRAGADSRGPAGMGREESGMRRFGSIRASLLLSSWRRAPGPRCLALLVGAGAGAGEGEEGGGVEGAVGCEGAAGEGTRVPGPLSWLLDCRPPLLGAWSACPTIVTVMVT